MAHIFSYILRNLYTSMRSKSELQPEAVRIIASYSLQIFSLLFQIKALLLYNISVSCKSKSSPFEKLHTRTHFRVNQMACYKILCEDVNK